MKYANTGLRVYIILDTWSWCIISNRKQNKYSKIVVCVFLALLIAHWYLTLETAYMILIILKLNLTPIKFVYGYYNSIF